MWPGDRRMDVANWSSTQKGRGYRSGMVQIDAKYDGSLRCTVHHAPSASELQTDAPLDNHGRGERFSPTDLVGAALATCTLTIMGILAERHGISLEGATAEVTKEMIQNPKRRIGRLPVTITIPTRLTDEQKTRLENGARNCPVHASLHPDIEAPIHFVYSADES